MVYISLGNVLKFLEMTSQLMLEDVSWMSLLLLTHPSTDIAVLQLSTLHWQRSLSMEKSLSKKHPKYSCEFTETYFELRKQDAAVPKVLIKHLKYFPISDMRVKS